MTLRAEFVALAQTNGVSIRGLCRRFGIAPTTAYKWLNRAKQDGGAGLADQSRRPHTSPRQTASAVEEAVLALRDEHPAWGGRKLAARLRALGQAAVPSPSTITAILRRSGRLAVPERPAHAWQRFERPVPINSGRWTLRGTCRWARAVGGCIR
jgi:transposase-like protein